MDNIERKKKPEQMVSVFDPSRDVYYSVPVPMAIQYIKASQKLAKLLIAREYATPEQLSID
jgi:hypothetical protein